MTQVRFVPCKNIMKSIIVFYSLTGKTAEIAKQKAIEEMADLIERQPLLVEKECFESFNPFSI